MIFKQLTDLQNELKAPKGQYNSFGKYKYRNCEDILEALKPLLAKHELALYITDEIVQIGERYYVKANAILTSTKDNDETQIVVSAFAREEESKKGMDGSQVTGASSSYARKYALNGLFAIDDTKDSDTTNKGETDWRQEYIKVCKQKKIDPTEYAQNHGIDRSTTQEQYKDIVADLKSDTISMSDI